jgi:Zn-dependent protease
MTFDTRELRDLLIAWLVLGLAFTLFFAGGAENLQRTDRPVELFVISLVTAGFGFLLHELAHRAVATHFGQRARFQADYNMLFLAVMTALVGLLFAAPGAVRHRGHVTDHEHGLIALAGPATNVGLTGLFLLVSLVPGLEQLGQFGILVNAFLAAFNMLPIATLDGRTVANWSWARFAVAFSVCVGLVLWALDRVPLESLV